MMNSHTNKGRNAAAGLFSNGTTGIAYGRISDPARRQGLPILNFPCAVHGDILRTFREGSAPDEVVEDGRAC